jgi:hypothetical protein
MSHLRLTTVRDLDGEPIATVDAQFVTSTHLPHTWLVIATADGEGVSDGGRTAHLDSYGPFAEPDGARVWAEAHLTPYATRYTVVPLTAPYTYADVEKAPGKPVRTSPPRPARANTIASYFKPYTLTRLRYGTRTDTPRHGFTAREVEHAELGPVVELTALGPDSYRRERDHSLMKTVLRHDHPRYEVTDQHTHLLVRRLSDAELHVRADQAADRVTPTLSALTTNTPAAPTAGAEVAYTLFDAVLRAARERASDTPDDYDLMGAIDGMDAPDALAALKEACLPSDMIEPVAEALALLAPHTFAFRAAERAPASRPAS